MHSKVYKCTHCGRKGHLTKFYFDKEPKHVANKKVPYKANPQGPKRKWVPKSPPCVLDVGVGSHKTWERWCLGGGCTWTWWTYFWCTAIKEVWWYNHHVLGIWSIVHVLVTISKTPNLFTCFFIYDIFSIFMFYLFCAYVVKTWLDVVFVKIKLC